MIVNRYEVILLIVFVDGVIVPVRSDDYALIVPVPIILAYPFLLTRTVIKSEVFVEGALLTSPNLITYEKPEVLLNG